MAKTKEYTRLPGKGRSGLITIETLWAGENHLLAIFNRRFSEEYKRFYFNDIQAVITQKTHNGKIINIVLGLLIAFFSLFLLPGWSGFPGVMTGFLLLLLMINLLRGPTCHTYIRTAIQTERIPSLHRLRTAEKVMDRLKPLIEKAQGALRREDIVAAPPVFYRPMQPSRPATVISQDRGNVHVVLFGILLLSGVISIYELFLNNRFLVALSYGSFFGVSITLIIAIIRQHNSSIKKSIQNLTWITLLFIIISASYTIVVSFSLFVRHLMAGPDMGVIEHYDFPFTSFQAAMDPLGNPWLFAAYLMRIAGCLLLGFLGLCLIRKGASAPQGQGDKTPTGPDAAGAPPQR